MNEYEKYNLKSNLSKVITNLIMLLTWIKEKAMNKRAYIPLNIFIHKISFSISTCSIEDKTNSMWRRRISETERESERERESV
jgi:hypothetical protein